MKVMGLTAPSDDSRAQFSCSRRRRLQHTSNTVLLPAINTFINFITFYTINSMAPKHTLEIFATRTRKTVKKTKKIYRFGYTGLGKMVDILWPADGKYYTGRITMYYPPSSVRSNGYYKIAYLGAAERELVNLDTTKRKWNVIEPSNHEDDFVGKVGYINIAADDTIKEKAEKFVRVMDYRYRPELNSLYHYIFWNKEMVFAYIDMSAVEFTPIELYQHFYLDIANGILP